MDKYISEILFRQTKRWHPKKSSKWIVNKYFKISNHPIHKWKWTFTDPKSGKQVDKMFWINIKYGKCARHKATPYDVEYEEYFVKHQFRTPFQCLYG